MNTLHVKVFVDVIALLSNEPLKKSVHMFDDGGMGSKGQGTHELLSAVLPGQFIRWSINALDVQTQVWIKEIKFGASLVERPAIADDEKLRAVMVESEPLSSECEVGHDIVPLWGKSFEGFIPLDISPKESYSYNLDLAFSGDCSRVITLNGPSVRMAHECSMSN